MTLPGSFGTRSETEISKKPLGGKEKDEGGKQLEGRPQTFLSIMIQVGGRD